QIGRGNLPAWVVRILSVLRCMVFLLTAQAQMAWAPLSPELGTRQSCPLSHGLELGPDDGGVDFRLCGGLRGEAAVASGDDVLPSYEGSIFHQAISHRLRMFLKVGGMRDDSGNQHLPLGQLDALPDAPLMVMARIGRLEGVGASVDLQEQVNHVLQAY